jgi:hypothetical protein
MKSYSSIFGDELGVTLNVRSEDVAMVWGHMHFDLRRFQGGGLTSNEVYQCFVKHLNEANEALNLTLSSLKNAVYLSQIRILGVTIAIILTTFLKLHMILACFMKRV